MLTALWIVNGMLATSFAIAGLVKIARPKERIRATGAIWTDRFSDMGVKAIGGVEVVGALGLVLPLATGIVPVLAPVAALALVVHMSLAIRIHRQTGENVVPAAAHAAVALVSAGLGFAHTLG